MDKVYSDGQLYSYPSKETVHKYPFLEWLFITKKRVATSINFLSFISIDIKGFPFDFGGKIFTAFEMTVCHKRRVETTLNFLSFISIIMKGFSFNFGIKIFTGFEMAELESWSISFFDILCSKIAEKCGSVTFKFCHFKGSEDFSTKIKWEPLDINTNEWQEVDDCCYPFSVINSHFKMGIYVLSLYWGINTLAYHCIICYRLGRKFVICDFFDNLEMEI